MLISLSEEEIDDLLYFARTGDQEEFNAAKKVLLKREAASLTDLLKAARDEYSGNGVLHMAAANGFDGLIKELCKELNTSGPQSVTMLEVLNAQNQAGNTPLHWAALNGHLECVKVLLEEGADPTVRNQSGHDAVYEAELNDKTEVVEWVLKEGGDGLEEGLGESPGGHEESDEVGINGDEQDAESAGGQNTKMDEGEALKLEDNLGHLGISTNHTEN